MPDNPISDLDYRPSYCFERFDTWMEQLERLLGPAVFAAVVTALEEQGRDLTVRTLANKHRLKREAVELVQLLSQFGDLGHPVHSFASVHVAEVTARSVPSGKRMTTYVCATRRGERIDYWWADHPGTASGAGCA